MGMQTALINSCAIKSSTQKTHNSPAAVQQARLSTAGASALVICELKLCRAKQATTGQPFPSVPLAMLMLVWQRQTLLCSMHAC